ncbi:acyltransferase [Halobacteria archaeon HArc-curdl5-1]|uniref:Acyltransferase n=1 Tax=Halapricum hydrolyticum TaxID=2979991 RepID=A0AAE3IDH3_9EURY|nr:acyltransferase [Halapricum hydrolyticum]MCU4719621.1 acyltransferase [Halapricum hydrolyticum]MCU4728530.1 acyltransferase [Halapricum hydrolyticum]
MWSKLRKGIKYPTQILIKSDDVLGRVRAKVEYEKNSQISPLAKIRNPEMVEIGTHSKIFPLTVLKPKDSGIVIGDHCTIHEFGFLAGNISIGDNVRVAQKVSMHSFDHNIDRTQEIRKQSLNKGEVIIQDDVWIGCDVTILKDVEIGEGAVIGAGSVVTDDVEPYTIVAGNPASQIGIRD